MIIDERLSSPEAVIRVLRDVIRSRPELSIDVDDIAHRVIQISRPEDRKEYINVKSASTRRRLVLNPDAYHFEADLCFPTDQNAATVAKLFATRQGVTALDDPEPYIFNAWHVPRRTFVKASYTRLSGPHGNIDSNI
jgi:hypothetical protein